MRSLTATAALLCLALPCQPAIAQYPPVQPPRDGSALGTGVQRTMTLLATSTPAHRNHVRVLFYGQSITEQAWSKAVADDLRKRFPNADLEIENRAIGGFASQMLIMPAEHDVYPWYPDLVIFHVYGANGEYEQIVKSIRGRTTAEVLMQRDHVTAWPQDQPDEKADKGLWWDYMMNNVFLPDIAKKYGCGLADVRGGWLDYLKANHLEPKALLKDGVHLNEHGCYVMAELVKRHLVYRPDLPKAAWKDTVRMLVVGKDVKWQGGRLRLEFEGNRVDALSAWSGAGDAGRATVLVDGKAPSEFPEAYCITRPTPGPWSPLFVARIDHTAPLVAEDWTLRITALSDDGKGWKFDVTGSVTGPDGSGESTQEFVSKSGRVKIAPQAHFNSYGGSRPTIGYECKWRVLPMHTDTYTPPKVGDPARETATILIQGIANARHTLEIISTGGKPLPIRAVRIYTPPVK